MSIIVASGQAISDNLLNHSISKQMYTIPKAQRFHEFKKCSSSTFLYNIPDKMSTRKAFIGYGTKSDFTKDKDSNPPFYNIARLFETPHPTAPKYSFGLGRNYFKKVVVGNEVSNPVNISPGPAQYNYLVPFGKGSSAYTVPKNRSLKAGQGEVISPGPAKYVNNLNINLEGRYTLSRFRNSPMNGWSLSKSQRFKYNYPNTPGANAYQLEDLIKGNGKIYDARFKSSTSNTMSKKFIDPYSKRFNTPGPGAYQFFSEFGIYRSKNADKMERKELYGTKYSKMSKSASMDDMHSKQKIEPKKEEVKNEEMNDPNSNQEKKEGDKFGEEL